MKPWAAMGMIFLACAARAGDELHYQLTYARSSPREVSVRLTLPHPLAAPVTFVMPRTYPGGYAQLGYDGFVVNLTATGALGKPLSTEKDVDAPRWLLGKRGEVVSSLSYHVDVARMEQGLHDAVSTSKVRERYAALLGYSVFGYVEGVENQAISLTVESPQGWPLLLTLAPDFPQRGGPASAQAADYYDLADSQILMGPDLKVSKLEGTIALFMAVYAEGAVDAALEGRLAREALDRVQAYFGDQPIPQYTVQLELLRPLPGHAYGFSQEHISSGTFSLSVDAALQEDSAQSLKDRTRFNFAHHMAHSWIPKRTYGVGYRPFSWEMTPVMDTIWFNEGFGRYAAIAAIAAGLPPAEGEAFRRAQLQSLQAVVDEAPSFIRRMPLDVLSREASFLYSADFRTGKNVFARGALMAAQMDERIGAQSKGARSLKDALRWLLRWSAEHQQAFQSDNLPGYFATATGVDVADIYHHWQEPLETP
jgi:predicted metalloprotease with PDZ domain